MVSLEQALVYTKNISASPKMQSFDSLLLGNPLEFDCVGMNEADQIYFGLLSAIQTNNKTDFEKYYARKSKSNPTKDSPSPFVNDDFLLFLILIGVNKFSYEKSWIRNIVSLRSRSPITITFENLLTEDYYSKAGLPEVIYMYLHLCNKSFITNDFTNYTFKQISENASLFDNRSDFQIICSIRAYNLIILQKAVVDRTRETLLNQFEANFIKRAKIISWILQTSLFCGLLYLLLKLPTYSSKAISLVNEYGYIFTILGALGLTFLGNLIPVIKNLSQAAVMRVMGYPNGLALKDSIK